ncbi:MAG: tetratricopeptide repeat protein [Anaerolineales bacterium]|nr:tetratricopeptide repeat protein [Anaerolineales bacterium]
MSSTSSRSPRQGFHSKGFLEGINILHDEIELAVRWQRPSILLAALQTQPQQTLAQRALEKKLSAVGLAVQQITPQTNATDLILQMCRTPRREKTVFFVSQLANVNQLTHGAIYRALNLHREHLVEQKICVVFWLTSTEAAQLPHAAPDFWAFRHRVVEFAPPRGSRRPPIPSEIFVWQSNLPVDEKARAEYETQLNALTPQAEIKTRLALTLGLLQLNWQLHHLEHFSKHLQGFAQLVKKEPSYLGWLDNLNGLKAFSADERQSAWRHFEQARTFDPANSVFVINSAISAHSLGKNQAAIRLAKQAAQDDPQNLEVWKTLGWLYLSMDRSQDAVKTLEAALGNAPNQLGLRLALAGAYLKNNQPEACRAQLAEIHRLGLPRDLLQEACLEILQGHAERALKKLRAAYQSKALGAGQILQNPNLRALVSLQVLSETTQP